MSQTTEQIKAALRQAPHPLTKTEIVRSGQFRNRPNERSVHFTLLWLVEQGELEQVWVSTRELRRAGRPAGTGSQRKQTRAYRLADSPF